MFAATRVKVLKQAAELSLLEARLLTGRTHQIRVHLAHVGHPILGDEKYGGGSARRLLLHAAKLAFRHPLTGEPLRLESPMPSAMQALVP
jgi:23S rRNA-/tRNA-specific pseudouridylate synthase